MAGARREFDTEIVDQLSDERVAWRTVSGDVEQMGVVTFQQGHLPPLNPRNPPQAAGYAHDVRGRPSRS